MTDLDSVASASVYSPFRTDDREPQSATKIDRLTAVVHAAIAGARMVFRRLLASLHESRRQQALREFRRYRDLIHEPDGSVATFEVYSPPENRK